MDKIIIKNLLVRGIIGINESERQKKQDILINIEAYADLTQAGKTDDIENCINYKTLAHKVINYVEKSNRYTVEALATDIAKLGLEDKKVVSIKVRVEKPGALRYTQSAGVEIERTRETMQQ